MQFQGHRVQQKLFFISLHKGSIEGRCQVAFNILWYTKFRWDTTCALCLTTRPQKEMSMVTYILIFAHLRAIGSFRKPCSVTIANISVNVLTLRSFFLHYANADLKQLLETLYVTFDTYILKSW